MAKIPFNRNGELVKKQIPKTKRVCPENESNANVGRLTGACHDANIVGVLTKMREGETVEDLLNRRSRVDFELEVTCPRFAECHLQAKVTCFCKVEKDKETGEVSKTFIPMRRVESKEGMTPDEWDQAKKARTKLRKKSENYVGKKKKADNLLCRPKTPLIKFHGEVIRTLGVVKI